MFDDLAAGRDVRLPNLGMETLHHVHVDDVRAFALALAAGRVDWRVLSIVSPRAMTLRGYAGVWPNGSGTRGLTFLAPTTGGAA